MKLFLILMSIGAMALASSDHELELRDDDVISEPLEPVEPIEPIEPIWETVAMETQLTVDSCEDTGGTCFASIRQKSVRFALDQMSCWSEQIVGPIPDIGGKNSGENLDDIVVISPPAGCEHRGHWISLFEDSGFGASYRVIPIVKVTKREPEGGVESYNIAVEILIGAKVVAKMSLSGLQNLQNFPSVTLFGNGEGRYHPISAGLQIGPQRDDIGLPNPPDSPPGDKNGPQWKVEMGSIR